MVIKTRFRNGTFQPVKKMTSSFKENDIVEIEIRVKKEFLWRGALKEMKISSVELQHKIKDMW